MDYSEQWADPLLNAIENDDKDLALNLIHSGHSVNGNSKDDYSPLHIAVIKNDKEICNALLAAKANVNAIDKFGATPLIRACFKASLEIVELLISAGADATLTKPSSVSALHIAAQWSSLEIFKYLIQVPGIDTRAGDMFQRTVLNYAMDSKVDSFRSIEIKALLLIHSGVDINAQNYIGETVLDCVGNLPEKRYDFFFQYGADPAIRDKKGDNFLNRHMKVETSFDYDIFLKEFLTNGCKFFSKEKVKDVINDNGSGGNTPFLRACASLFAPVAEIEMFIQCGADIQSSNSMGRTALHLASRDIYLACPGVVEYLIENGADVNAKDMFGETPIYKMKTAKLVRTLIDAGADLNNKDRHGRTPLLALMNLKDPKVIEILLTSGASVTCTDDSGSGPLHYASYHNDTETVKLLLLHSCDIDLRDNNGYTPVSYATSSGNIKVANLLQEAKMESEPKVLYERMGQCSLHDTAQENDTSFVPKRSETLELINYNLVEEGKQSIEDFIKLPSDYDQFVENLLSEPGIGIVSHEAKEIKSSVLELMENIRNNMEEKDSRFKISIVQTGSATEGVKVGDPDEFDFVFCLNVFAEMFKVVEVPALEPLGFAKLTLADKKKRKEFEPFVKEDDGLWTEVLYEQFFFLLDQVVIDRSVWTNKHLVYDERVYQLGNKPPFNLNITWVGAWYKHLRISIDIVPAIRKQDWAPSCVLEKKEAGIPFLTEDILAEGCFLLIQPISPDFQLQKENVLRISLAPVEIKRYK